MTITKAALRALAIARRARGAIFTESGGACAGGRTEARAICPLIGAGRAAAKRFA
jgi:hypothetical protein